MIKEIIEETMLGMSGKLFALGLSRFQLNDSFSLAETTVLLVFRDKVMSGKTQELLNILNGVSAPGKIAFVQNFIQDFSKKGMEKKLVKNYRTHLAEKLQMNDLTATLIAEAAIPEILKSVIGTFSKINVCENKLAELVNEGLPLHPAIDFNLQNAKED
jgi:hypothetical protein